MQGKTKRGSGVVKKGVRKSGAMAGSKSTRYAGAMKKGGKGGKG